MCAGVEAHSTEVAYRDDIRVNRTVSSLRTPRRRCCSLVSEQGGQAPHERSRRHTLCYGSYTRLLPSRDDAAAGRRHTAARRRREQGGVT